MAASDPLPTYKRIAIKAHFSAKPVVRGLPNSDCCESLLLGYTEQVLSTRSERSACQIAELLVWQKRAIHAVLKLLVKPCVAQSPVRNRRA
jgi:hypothetical protein